MSERRSPISIKIDFPIVQDNVHVRDGDTVTLRCLPDRLVTDQAPVSLVVDAESARSLKEGCEKALADLCDDAPDSAAVELEEAETEINRLNGYISSWKQRFEQIADLVGAKWDWGKDLSVLVQEVEYRVNKQESDIRVLREKLDKAEQRADDLHSKLATAKKAEDILEAKLKRVQQVLEGSGEVPEASQEAKGAVECRELEVLYETLETLAESLGLDWRREMPLDNLTEQVEGMEEQD